MPPRVSEGSLTPWLPVSVSVLGIAPPLFTKGGDLCRGSVPEIGATFVRTMWSRSCGKSWSPSRTVPRVLTRPDTACASRVIVAHFEVSDVSTIMATLETLAITQLMFVLCSAPCKARRFAPPARARGLRALTVPARRSRLGQYVMAGGCDGIAGPILTVDRASKWR